MLISFGQIIEIRTYVTFMEIFIENELSMVQFVDLSIRFPTKELTHDE